MLAYSTLLRKRKYDDKMLGEYVYNLLDKTLILPDDFSYEYIEVTEDYVARPDLVSIALYDTDMYADVLCKINGISNPFELNEGDLLVCPLYTDIEKFFTNDTEDIEIDTSTTTSSASKSTAKTKKDKRTANEALVTDERFKIDKNKRIVIY